MTFVARVLKLGRVTIPKVVVECKNLEFCNGVKFEIKGVAGEAAVVHDAGGMKMTIPVRMRKILNIQVGDIVEIDILEKFTVEKRYFKVVK